MLLIVFEENCFFEYYCVYFDKKYLKCFKLSETFSQASQTSGRKKTILVWLSLFSLVAAFFCVNQLRIQKKWDTIAKSRVEILENMSTRCFV